MFVFKLFTEIYIDMCTAFHMPSFSGTLLVAFKLKVNSILCYTTSPRKISILREKSITRQILGSHANKLAIPI
jgi:hypothetical protein